MQSEINISFFQHITRYCKHFISNTGVVTLTIFFICWLSFVIQITGNYFVNLFFYPSLTLTNFIDNPFRVITPIFLHFSWLHIILNTVSWSFLGNVIEQRFKKKSLIILLLTSAIIANTAEYLVSGPNFGGLSGVVYATFGYLWWQSWLAPQSGIVMPKAIINMSLLWLVIGYANILPINIGNTAHLAGLVCGCLMAFIQIKWIK